MNIETERALTDNATLHPTSNASNAIDLETPTTTHGHKKIVALLSLLQKDIIAADFKWSLFVSALSHYRWDSCLKPFPADYVKANGFKDIESLTRVVESFSSMEVLKSYLEEPDIYYLQVKLIDLAYWVLIESKDMQIHTVAKKVHDSVLALVPCEAEAPRPNWLFEVTSKSDGAWQEMLDGRKSLYAYHGSRLENFYSILHHGLQQHMNKTGLFGQGVYLSSELSVSLPYSPMGLGWATSSIGNHLSIVALCEMVDHPDVKCQNKEFDKSRAITKDSVGGEVPNKYYVVQNSDLVRVRYLLVYSRKQQPAIMHSSSSIVNWFKGHKLLTFIVGYFAFLAALGLTNNNQVLRLYRRFLRQLGLH